MSGAIADREHLRSEILDRLNNGGNTVATNSNFLIKVTDAKMPEVKKALEGAGITVRSIIALHKEETGADEATEGKVSE